jgi:hypothetical protein
MATTYTGQHNTDKSEHTSIPGAGFEPTIPVFERLKAVLILDRAATGTIDANEKDELEIVGTSSMCLDFRSFGNALQGVTLNFSSKVVTGADRCLWNYSW